MTAPAEPSLFAEYAFIGEVLPDLNGIEGGAFFDLVAHHPEGKAIVAAVVFTDASHIHRVASIHKQRHRILIPPGIV